METLCEGEQLAFTSPTDPIMAARKSTTDLSQDLFLRKKIFDLSEESVLSHCVCLTESKLNIFLVLEVEVMINN